MTLRVGWLSTANGAGSLGMLEAVLAAIDAGRLDARLEFVFVNRSRGHSIATDRYMELVESRGIPLVALSSRDFWRDRGGVPWSRLRGEFDREALSLLSDFRPDVSVQAGYMLYAPVLCQSLLMLNQHPALPGMTVGTWQDAIWDVIEARSPEAGSMVHVSTEELDSGPVVSCCRFPVFGPDWDSLWSAAGERPGRDRYDSDVGVTRLFDAIRHAGMLRERPLVVRTLGVIADGVVPLEGMRSGSFGQAMDLTDIVESDVAGMS